MWENGCRENGCRERDAAMDNVSCGCERRMPEMPSGPCDCDDKRSMRCDTKDKMCGESSARSTCDYRYNISHVQVSVRGTECFLNMIKELECHFKKHFSEIFAGIQVYEVSCGVFVVITRLYDKKDCDDKFEKMMNHTRNMYDKTFGRRVRRSVILSCNRARKVHY